MQHLSLELPLSSQDRLNNTCCLSVLNNLITNGITTKQKMENWKILTLILDAENTADYTDTQKH